MRNLIIGLLIGALSAPALAGLSIMHGWTVRIGTKVICEDPYINMVFQEIDCPYNMGLEE